jgi:hypothetical protein
MICKYNFTPAWQGKLNGALFTRKRYLLGISYYVFILFTYRNIYFFASVLLRIKEEGQFLGREPYNFSSRFFNLDETRKRQTSL